MEEPPSEEPPLKTRRGRALAVISGLRVDPAPLRESRDFRLLWFSTIVSEFGTHITFVAVTFQVYKLTRSAAMVGLIGLVKFVPLVASSILGGPLADRLDRRRLLLVTQMVYAVSSTILVIAALMERPPLLLIFGAVALTAAVQGVDSPVRSSMTPNLVRREQLPGALALKQVAWNLTAVVGPAVGGLVIARFGLPVAYGLDVLSYVAAMGFTLMLRPMAPDRSGEEEKKKGLAAITEGFRFLKGRRVLQSTFGLDLFAMVFGMPRALFPILAEDQFGNGSAETVGLLFSAMAFGSLAGALTAGWVNAVKRQGRAVVLSVVVWGAAVTGFAFAGSLPVGMILLAIGGAADLVSAIFRSSILQANTPDHLRGRLSAIHILVVAGGPRLGDLESGLVAEALSPFASVVLGGAITIAGAGLIAARVPEFWKQRDSAAG
ncbi:MAG TPA: MFS transporter [Actinomycetota bacterium]|nr:MFS transporter [Actinomycetota bacterium]